MVVSRDMLVGCAFVLALSSSPADAASDWSHQTTLEEFLRYKLFRCLGPEQYDQQSEPCRWVCYGGLEKPINDRRFCINDFATIQKYCSAEASITNRGQTMCVDRNDQPLPRTR